MILYGLERKEFYEDRTIGRLYLPDHFNFYTLEDTDRQRQEDGTIVPWSADLKIYGKTAIPRGKYKIELDWSPGRQGLVPYLRHVKDFDAIQIHIANRPQEILGCIALGQGYDPMSHNILSSGSACVKFYGLILRDIIESKNDVWLEIG